MFRCDNQCSEKTLSFLQLASVVIQEGEESNTTNFLPEMLQRFSEGKRRNTLTNWQWRQFAGQKAHRGRLWKMMGKEQYVRGMWEHLCQERENVKRFREQAAEEIAGRNTGSVAAGIASQRVL